MSETVQLVLIGTIFRIICLLAGLGFALIGYRLYVKGVFEKTDDIKAAFGKAKIAIRNVAPGVVFGLAGIAIATLGVVRPIWITPTPHNLKNIFGELGGAQVYMRKDLNLPIDMATPTPTPTPTRERH